MLSGFARDISDIEYHIRCELRADSTTSRVSISNVDLITTRITASFALSVKLDPKD